MDEDALEELRTVNARLDELSRILCLLVLTTAAGTGSTPGEVHELGAELKKIRDQHA